MTHVTFRTHFDALTDLIVNEPDDEAVDSFRFPEALRQREQALRNRQGDLTSDEMLELSKITYAQEVLRLWQEKLRAQRAAVTESGDDDDDADDADAEEAP